MRKLITLGVLFATACAFAEIQVIDGVKYECKDGLCMIVEDDGAEATNAVPERANGTMKSRMVQGYLSADEFIQWLNGGDAPEENRMLMNGLSGWSGILVLFAILLGGLAMNLTPCVLPMVPVNLMVIGKSAARGVWYGLGMALAYGTLGVAAAVGGLAFGTIQGSPWFNLGVAVVFVLLAMALSGLFFIDLSKGRNAFAQKRTKMLPWLFAFVMGVLSAMLAGACVAPILIGVLVLTAKLYAEGKVLALALPFVLGVGMALPWPFLGAGLRVLPKPGAWMKGVNRLFALIVLGFAVWYGRLAWQGFVQNERQKVIDETVIEATPSTLNSQLSTLNSQLSTLNTESAKPILIDCWASWCKNCAAMDKVLSEPKVREALRDFTVIRLQAENMRELVALPGFESIKGLPAFVILY